MAITHLQREVLRQVILAQAASDSGKGIVWDTNVPGYQEALRKGYAAKPFHELRAVELINSAPPCGISYSVCGDAPYCAMVYFNFGRNFLGTWCQVSFHNPGIPRDSKLRDLWNHGKQTSWVGNRYFPKKFVDSRQNCQKLAKLCGWYIEPLY